MDKFSDLLFEKLLHGLGMDWARTGVTSFDSKSDFHDVIYHIQSCNVDNLDGVTSNFV